MSNISRLLRHCEEQGLVKLVPDTEDGRSRLIQLTAKGRRAFEREVLRDNEIARNALGGLEDVHVAAIGDFFDLFGTCLGAPLDPQRVGESKFVHSQMRLARALGMLGSNYLGTGIEISEYQALNALAQSETPLRIKELIQCIALEQSSVSRMLSLLVKRRWLGRTQAAGDARGIEISFTAEGRRVFRALEGKVLTTIRETLAMVPKGITNDFLKAARQLESVIKEAESGEPRIELSVVAPRTSSDWCRLRAFFIEVLTERNQHHRLSSELLPERVPTRYVIDSSGRIHGIAFAKSKEPLSVFVRSGPLSDAATVQLKGAWEGQRRLQVPKKEGGT